MVWAFCRKAGSAGRTVRFSDILNEAESYVDVHYYPEPDMEEVLRENPEPKKKKSKGYQRKRTAGTSD